MSSVSVFVPCHNYGRYLRGCVDSVLGQEGVEVEVLILDDASGDDSEEVGRALAAGDARVSYRRHARNDGHIATYNEGVAWARGTYVVLLSADDLLAPGALARATRLMDAHPGIGFTYGRKIRFHDGEPLPPARATSGAGTSIPGWSWIAERCRRADNDIASPEVVVRAALHHRLGGYRPDLPHTADLELWLRLAAHGDVGVLDADQAYYRQHAASMQVSRHGSELIRLEQRRDAFAALLDQPGAVAGSAGRLRRRVVRRLAAEALWLAAGERARGRRASSDLLLAFAREVGGARLGGSLLYALRTFPAVWVSTRVRSRARRRHRRRR